MKLRSKITFLYILLVVIYAALLFLLPPPQETLHRYHITALELRLIDAAIIIPYALIWLAGFYGFTKLKAYSLGIKRAKDGREVNKIANGLFILALWPPLSSILATALNWWVVLHPGAKGASIIINDYFNLVWPLVGFVIISVGARRLSEMVKARPSHGATNLMALGLIGLGVAYGYLVSRSVSQAEHYPLPYWLVLTTLVIPYIFMWFLGVLAAYEVYLYRCKVAGVVYRRSWGLLAYGIGAIIAMQIIVQYANTISADLNQLPVGWMILVVYVVLILLSIGYLLVARGARYLQRIEEV